MHRKHIKKSLSLLHSFIPWTSLMHTLLLPSGLSSNEVSACFDSSESVAKWSVFIWDQCLLWWFRKCCQCGAWCEVLHSNSLRRALCLWCAVTQAIFCPEWCLLALPLADCHPHWWWTRCSGLLAASLAELQGSSTSSISLSLIYAAWPISHYTVGIQFVLFLNLRRGSVFNSLNWRCCCL